MSEQQTQMVRRWFEEVWNQGRRQTIDDHSIPSALFMMGSPPSKVLWSFICSLTACERVYPSSTSTVTRPHLKG